MSLTDAMYEGRPQGLSAAWADLKEIAEASKPLGQFPFESLSGMVHEMSDLTSKGHLSARQSSTTNPGTRRNA